MHKNKFVKNEGLSNIHKELMSVYTLTEIEQEALDLCCENDKDCSHISTIIDLILDKFKRTLDKLEIYIKN